MSVLEALSRLSLSNRSSSAVTLRPGTAVEATVLRAGLRADQANSSHVARVLEGANGPRSAPGGALQSIVVGIRGTQVHAVTDLPLQPGQRVSLAVESVSPQVLLRVVGDAGQKSSSALAARSPDFPTGPQLMGQRAAIQAPLSGLAGAGRSAVAVHNLSELGDPQTLQTAVGRSGSAYERHLSEFAAGFRTQASGARWLTGGQFWMPASPGLELLQSDNKAMLLRQLAESQQVQRHQAPLVVSSRVGGETQTEARAAAAANEIKALESGLARIELNQLLSINDQSGIRHPLRVEMPVLVDGEVRDLLLELDVEDDPNNAAASRTKLARVRLDLPNLGLFGAELRLRDDALWVSVWAEQPDTRELLEQRAAQLHQRLQDSGLPGPRITVLDDIPATGRNDDELASRLPRGLLAVDV